MEPGEKRASVGDEPCVGLALSWDPKLRGSRTSGLDLHFTGHPLWHLTPKPLLLTCSCLYFLSCDGDWPWAKCHGQTRHVGGSSWGTAPGPLSSLLETLTGECLGEGPGPELAASGSQGTHFRVPAQPRLGGRCLTPVEDTALKADVVTS